MNRHQGVADLQRRVDAGRGDVPLIELRWRCANCRSRLTDFVCAGWGAIGVRPRRPGAADGSAFHPARAPVISIMSSTSINAAAPTRTDSAVRTRSSPSTRV